MQPLSSQTLTAPVVTDAQKQQMVNVYCGLKERWWYQIYDGKYHGYGPDVFDKGLHGDQVEPGYYSSIKKACEFACQHLEENPTVDFYKSLHKVACAHFAGAETCTNITAEETGIFTGGAAYCKNSLDALYKTLSTEEINEVKQQIWNTERIAKAQLQLSFRWNKKEEVLKWNNMTEEHFDKDLLKKTEFEKKLDEKIEKINTYIAERSKQLGASEPIAEMFKSRVNDYQKNITVSYKASRHEAEIVAKKLFEEFSTNVAKARTEDEKIWCCADLFQMLEWLHPYSDGQGRTDLVLLGKVLTENGLNPPILDEPYVSTFNTREDWFAYLKKGIEKWKEEAKASSPGT